MIHKELLKELTDRYLPKKKYSQNARIYAKVIADLYAGEIVKNLNIPVLATALSKKQKLELLEKSQIFEALTFKQIRALIWWECFKPKKLNKFYEMLQIGKAARFAFEDAQRYGSIRFWEFKTYLI